MLVIGIPASLGSLLLSIAHIQETEDYYGQADSDASGKAGSEQIYAGHYRGGNSKNVAEIQGSFGVNTYAFATLNIRKPCDEVFSLLNCYKNSLILAKEYGVRSIAFPSISTGVFHFSLDMAAQIAVSTVRRGLWRNISTYRPRLTGGAKIVTM